jgi:Uma2 family endonuclease
MLNVHNAIHDNITEQDYLDGEKNSTIKHEYIDGKIYAMAGSSKRHRE